MSFVLKSSLKLILEQSHNQFFWIQLHSIHLYLENIKSLKLCFGSKKFLQVFFFNKCSPRAKRFKKAKCLAPSQSFARMCGYLFHNFPFLQHDCQLSSCLNGGLCTFIDASKTFTCVNHCVGSPCLNGGSCRNLADGYRCSCVARQFAGKQCEQGIARVHQLLWNW